ncbi:hypothetical protein TUM4438_31310 [Shewanella sairae]|uniref:Relaxosome protein TraY n=1 Tax=Shewanella sairae TaxID=190310 RepID=A0ABQ4PLD5_9GAMM|nr:TraY domain-containing protein [Shewanella sairae]MCL1131901.1 TraY domain-containing protein [Shewanella sairae]GIU48891.1 hypothetical protein TUM4438_31310 [Shewanella sairae]
MSESKKTTNVNVGVKAQTNKILTASAEKNQRSKKQEAAARLEHHLKNYGCDWVENN